MRRLVLGAVALAMIFVGGIGCSGKDADALKNIELVQEVDEIEKEQAPSNNPIDKEEHIDIQDDIAEETVEDNDNAEPNNGEPDSGEPDNGEASGDDTSNGEPDNVEPSNIEPDSGEPDSGEPDNAETGNTEPNDAESGDTEQNDNIELGENEIEHSDEDGKTEGGEECASGVEVFMGLMSAFLEGDFAGIGNIDIAVDSRINPYETFCRLIVADDGFYFAYFSFDDDLVSGARLGDFVSLRFDDKYIVVYCDGNFEGDIDFSLTYDYSGTFDDSAVDYGWGVVIFVEQIPDSIEIAINSNGVVFSTYNIVA